MKKFKFKHGVFYVFMSATGNLFIMRFFDDTYDNICVNALVRRVLINAEVEVIGEL